MNKSLFIQVEIVKNLFLFGKTMLREEIDASEWNVGKPNRDSTMGSWDDIHRLSVWWQAYPSKKKQELHLTKQQQRPNKKYVTILN